MQDRRYNLIEQDNPAVKDAFSMLSGNIHMKSENKALKSIVITSAEPKTGKTSVATNLAITMTNWGKKCILIDADMRKRSDVRALKWGSDMGLAHYLNGMAEFEEIISYTSIEGLLYIPNGNTASNPLGLLCSSRFSILMQRLKNDFDFIVIDSPALDSVSDAAVMSTKADGVLLVANVGETDLDALIRAKEKLEAANTNLLGVVLNRVGKGLYKKYLRAFKYFYNIQKKAVKKRRQQKNSVVA